LISKIFIDGIKIVCGNPEKLGNREISKIMGHYMMYFERQLVSNGEYEKWKDWKETFYTMREKTNILKEKLLWQSGVFKCEKCGKVMTTKYKSGRFCSEKCCHSRILSKESKKKMSTSVQKTMHSKEYREANKARHKIAVDNRKEEYFKNPSRCTVCGKILPYDQRYLKTCSEQCLMISYKTRTRWNIHRNQTSFAEKFFMGVLENNHIEYIHEHPVKKDDGIHCYYLDFLITINGKNIDLEIDGQQHDYRKDEDAIRDKYLTECGFIVYRIKWNDVIAEKGKQEMKEKIDLFLDFINALKI
jgi:hypothetical protein